MKKILSFVVIVILAGCNETIEEKDRIEGSCSFSKMTIMNFKAMKESVQSKGELDSGTLTVDLTGTMELSKTRIILAYSEESKSKDSELENDTVVIRKCILKEFDDGTLEYEYSTDKGEFSVFTNNSREIRWFSFNDRVNLLSFSK